MVPYPHAVDDHQTLNAHFLSDAGAGWLLPQNKLNASEMASWLGSLSRTELQARGEQARAQAKPQATARMVAVVKEIAK
jgi:UDP-N-acetylglucosamine--N-acetylmuramyl-(pentapeptide) pyrophosphoryl-undecaprenol N-acetylglucosamine transferase